MSNVVNLSDYRQETSNPKKKTKRRLKKQWRIFFILLILFLGTYTLLHSSVFTLNEVLVEGNYEVSTKKVIDLAEITTGGNLFELNKKQIKSNLEQYPFIKEVEFSYKLPNTFIIEILENQTLGFIVTTEGYIQFSEEGMVLAIASNMGKYNLPVITGVDLKTIPSPGGTIQSESFSEVLKLLNCADRKILNLLAEINISEEQIVAYTYQGVEIKIGFTEEIESRLHELNDIFMQISAQHIDINTIDYIDIRYKDVPTIKFKK